jgi:cytochrome c peroxidase
MKLPKEGRAAWLVLCVALAGACKDKQARAEPSPEPQSLQFQQEPLQPLPEASPEDAKAVALGNKLFHDPGLSGDHTIACATCHVIADGGDDNRQSALGIRGQIGPINTPTVLNCGYNFAQFWDGRAATLEEQVSGPLENPLEMGNTMAKVLSTLKADTGYAQQFSEAFSDGVTERNLRAAVASFERTLRTPNAPFDRWLRGETSALSADQVAGYDLFKRVGCIACHQGENVGGNMFQRFGVMGDYFKDRGHVTTADYGRYNVTHLESDRFVFRVPSLRNVERTAPYFHDGSALTLEQAVRTMGRYQLGRILSDPDVRLLVAFLKSLSGDLPTAPPRSLGFTARVSK